MHFLYNISIPIASVLLKLIGLFNSKIKAGVKGRQDAFSILEEQLSPTDNTLWFHCASLGEYEQGLPVFEDVKMLYPNHKIVLTFFSPSGYDVRKNSPVANIVVYLPLDSKKNAELFLDIVNPELTIFVKYDIWPNYLNALSRRNKNAILISALFRKNQIYFKPFGKFMLKSLQAFDHIFVQNEVSKSILNTNGIDSVSISGDTRFDRVTKQLEEDNFLATIEDFKGDKLCLIAGSTWPEDDNVLTHYINNSSNSIKFIIAPHNIKPKYIESLRNSISKKSVLFTKADNVTIKDAQVLILNTIGMLSKVYHYANIAYVGGAMGTTGLHNILEPAVFGTPIVIGPNYSKFPEAHQLLNNGGLFSVSNSSELKKCLDKLISDKTFRLEAGQKNEVFVEKNKGAVIQIMSFLRKYSV